MRRGYLILLGLVLAGCGQIPNPNDISTVDLSQRADTANRLLESVESTLQYKVEHGEISDIARMEYIRVYAEKLLKFVDKKNVPNGDQWKYATLLRVTGRWKEAQASLEEAARVADSPDRKINDTLKLAQAQAMNGDVPGAIKTAESTMKAEDKDAAPILPSVLYEIVPAGEGKGHDKELADLLKDAIACHQRVTVDRNTDEGREFIIRRPDHIRRANKKILDLMRSGH